METEKCQLFFGALNHLDVRQVSISYSRYVYDMFLLPIPRLTYAYQEYQQSLKFANVFQFLFQK